ncbi:hypothetical protein V6N12_026470 [Hibiscus sabdariffa]|uniref:Phosphoenolpyruvate carboxylase n=1 Tax=Hibiscus sabdariffa TaxID=183260 RepID=A0ABR2DV20_9ROSI
MASFINNNSKIEKLASIDAQLRHLVPAKVSEDDKLVEYDALLLDRFLDILQDLHGEDLKETEIRVSYMKGWLLKLVRKNKPKKLEELGNVLTNLDPGDSIVVAKAFSHMLNLANLAEEVQIAHHRRIKLKKGDFVDKNSATTESDLEETLKRLVVDMKKSPQEVFLMLSRTRLWIWYLLLILLIQFEDLSTSEAWKIQAAFRTDEIRRTPPTPQDEMRAGMSYFHETVWKGVPKFLRRVDTAFNNIGINERVPYNVPLIQFSSWMDGDRDAMSFVFVLINFIDPQGEMLSTT